MDYHVFEAGNVVLQSGATIRNCQLAYKTFGQLNARKDNAIVYPTWYSGQHYDNEWLVGDGMALDPEKWFIIIPNMLGNGLSSSLSNTSEPYNGPRFPRVTAYDNVRLQHRLVSEKFGIERLPLVAPPSQVAGIGPNRKRSCAPWRGSTLAGASHRRSIASNSISPRWAIPRLRISWSHSGRGCSSPRMPTTSLRCCGRGRTAI